MIEILTYLMSMIFNDGSGVLFIWYPYANLYMKYTCMYMRMPIEGNVDWHGYCMIKFNASESMFSIYTI